MPLPRLALLLGPLAATTLPARAADLPPEAVATWQAMVEVPRLEARFQQVRTSRILLRPLMSRGILRFERPGRLAWITESPGRSFLVMDGTRVGMAWPDLGVSEEVDLATRPEVAGLVQGMTVWLAADLAAVERDWTVTWSGGDPAHASLVPRDPVVAMLVSRLDLEIAGLPPVLRQVTIHEPDGDQVTILLSDIRPGAILPEDAFILPIAR